MSTALALQNESDTWAPMDGTARQWEEEFEFLERETPPHRYAIKLELFLLRLHASAHRFETQSDGILSD